MILKATADAVSDANGIGYNGALAKHARKAYTRQMAKAIAKGSCSPEQIAHHMDGQDTAEKLLQVEKEKYWSRSTNSDTLRQALWFAENVGHIDKSYYEVKMMYEATGSSEKEMAKRDLIIAVKNYKRDGRKNVEEIKAALHAASEAGYNGKAYDLLWKTYIDHETGFVDCTLKPRKATRLAAKPCAAKDIRLKEHPELAAKITSPQMYALAYERGLEAKADGWIQLPEPTGTTHDDLRLMLPPMPEGQDTKSIFIINEMNMKACRAGDVKSFARAVNAAREQGLADSLICRSTVALLKRHLQKTEEFHDAKEKGAEWEDWVEASGQPKWDKWAAHQENEPMPLMQTSIKLSLDHALAFANWAKDGTSPEGVSIATIVPDAFRSDLASSSSAWHNVEESEILLAKKKHNKMTSRQTQEDQDKRDNTWL